MIALYTPSVTASNRISWLLHVIFALVLASPLAAQGTFPVQVSGSLLAPRSLDLAVYGQDRPDDLFFDITLKDPTEEILQVRLAISVERNGQIIYQSDPNAALPPITLQQFEPLRIDGPTLLRYLSANGLATGALPGAAFEVPEGLNSICLQVFGVERDVAISRQFCTQGNFQLNLVPRLTLPAIGAEIRHTDPQNLLFTWVPMHLGSTNPPQPVEYDFQLVELPRGYYNANDAFRSALRVYDVTTASPTVVMGPGEPQLRADAVYAWRVRARSSLYPTSKLFQNEGYSQVSTFAVYGNAPFSQVNFITDNPAPQGCTVFATEYPIVTGDPNAAQPVGSGDVVKLGYFNMKVTEAGGSASAGYSGKGLVDFPMLNSKVEVEFSGLLVGEDRRVFGVDRVDGVVGEGFALSETQTSRENIATSVDARYIKRLESLVVGSQGRARLVTNRDASSEVGTNLPLAIDRAGQAPVVVTGLRFTTRGAYLNLVSWYRGSGQTTGAAAPFAATNVAATPYGLKTGAHLVALNGGVEGQVGPLEPITATIGLSSTGGTDVRMNIDCGGFADMKTSNSLQIDPRIMVRADNGATVQLDFAKTSSESLRRFMGEVNDVPAFVLPKLDGFIFTPTKSILDFRDAESTYSGTNTPGYAAARQAKWRGMAFDDLDVTLPPDYNFSGKGRPIVMTNGQLFVDDDGASYGRFLATKVKPFGNSRVGGSLYSIDTLGLDIDAGEARDLYFSGELKVPVFPDPFRARGTLSKDASQRVRLTATVPSTSRSMPMWMGEFIPFESSTVDGQLVKLGETRELYTRASFDGKLSLKLTEAELVAALPEKGRAELAQSIKQVLGVTSLNLSIENLVLEDFDIDPSAAPKERVELGAANTTKAIAKLGTKTLEWGEVHIVNELSQGDTPERLGLQLALYEGDNRVEFTLWSRMGKDGHYVFESISAEGSKLTCNCTSAVPVVDEGAWGSILNDVIDQHFASLVASLPTSGTQNTGPMGANALARNMLRVQLNATAKGGFPFLNAETTIIPWLKNRKLTVENVGGKFVGVSHITDPSKLTFAALADVPADKLPIDVTNRLTELGIKKENMPAHSRLLITGFTVGETATLSEGASMELTLLYEVEFKEGLAGDQQKDYLRFVSEAIPTGPQSINFSDRKFLLQNEAKMGGSQDRVNFLPEVTLRVNEGDEDSPKLVEEKLQSIATIDCHQGFRNFNVQAVYLPPFANASKSEGYGNSTQLVHRLSEMEDGQGAAQAKFFFQINTAGPESAHSLQYFIAPLQGKLDRADGEAFNFASVGAEQVIFKMGATEASKAFIDYTQTAAVEGSGQATLFRGLYFKDISWELDGFLGPNDEPLTFSLPLAKYDFVRGLTAEYEQGKARTSGEGAKIGVLGAGASSYRTPDLTEAQKQVPLVRTAGARMGGWKFGVSYVGFKLVDGKWGQLQQIQKADNGVYMEGAMHVPIFEENTTSIFVDEGKTEVLQAFEPGWVDYAGSVTFNAMGNTYAPESTLKFVPIAGDKVFQSAHIPFLGYRIAQGSSIVLDWAGEDKQFEPKATFNGFAGIYLVKGAAKMLGITGAAAETLSGISFKHELLQFKGLTLNEADSECDPGDTADQGLMTGIKSIDFGSWGPVTGSRADSLTGTILASAKQGVLDVVPELKGFPFSLDRVSIACFATDDMKDRYKITLGATLNLMGDEEASDKPKTTTAAAAPSAPAAGAEAKTSGIKAAGEMNIVFRTSTGFDGIELNCLLVEGKLANASITGGLNIFRSDGQDTKWGDGFKAGLELTLEGAGVGIKAVGQFGTTTFTPEGKVEPYRYFFMDLEGTYENGFPLPPLTPTSAPVVNLYGLGGGILINMDLPPSNDVLKAGETPVKLAEARSNDNCQIEGDMLKPGVNLYGMEYRPFKNRYGGNISVIAGNYIPPGSPKPFVGDISLRIGIKRNDAGTFAFDYIQLNGNGYIKPKSVAERRVEHVAQISVDIAYSTATKVLQGDVTVEASYPNDGGELVARKQTEANVQAAWKDKSLTAEARAAKVGQIRGDTAALRKMQKDNESAKYFVLENMRASLKMNFDTKDWGFKLGSWGDGKGIEPQSRLQYAAVKFPKLLGDSQARFYMQAGNQVDGIPPVSEIMPAWTAAGSISDAGKRNPELLKAGTGVAFGAMLDIDSGQKKVGPFSGYVRGRAGLDLSLMDMSGVTCGQGRETIGLNGWYGQGQAYLFADGKLNVDYDVWCCSGTINIFDAKLSAIIQAQLPNPSYLSGNIDGRYSVLKGLVKGSFNYKFAIGEKCEAFTDNTAVIAGIQIISDVFPSEGSTDFDITGAPRLAANLGIGETIDFPVYDSDMNEKSREYFRPMLKEVVMTNVATGAVVNLAVQYDETRQEITLQPDRWLDSKTKYRLTYRVEWEEDRNGDGIFVPLKQEKGSSAGQVMAETGTRTFTSGSFPEVIARGMLESQAPGYRQRFWHEGYASPLLRFKHGDPRLGTEMFKDDGQTANGTPIRYEYYAEIAQVLPQGAPSAATPIRLPITRRPGQQTFRKAIYGETSVRGNWTIPTVRYDNVAVREVEFPGLDEIDLVKGGVYRIRILQEGVTVSATSVTIDKMTQVAPNREVTTKKINAAAIAQNSLPVKVLYEYEFGVSRYNSLHEKLASAEVVYERSENARADMQSQKQEEEPVNLERDDWNGGDIRAHQFRVKDDYWRFVPGGAGGAAREALDQFDMNRLRANLKVAYLQDYRLEGGLNQRISQVRDGKKMLLEAIAWYRSHGNSAYANDLSYFLNHDPKSEREQDGTTWAYNLQSAAGTAQLSDTEIAQGQVSANVPSSRFDNNFYYGVFKKEKEYAFLYQDLRSRVQVGRAKWLAALGDHMSYFYDNWGPSDDYGDWRRDDDEDDDMYEPATQGYFYHNFRSVVDYRMWGYSAQEAGEGKPNPLGFHPGYASSYHGLSQLSFPKLTRWTDMNQQAPTGGSQVAWTIRPDHGAGKYEDNSWRDSKATVDKADPALSSPPLGIIRNEFGNQVNAINLPSGRRLRYVYIVTAPDARPVALVDVARRTMTRYSATGKVENTTYESDVTWYSGGANLEIKNLPAWTYSGQVSSATSRAHLHVVLADESGTYGAEQDPNAYFMKKGNWAPRYHHDNPFGPVTPLSNDAFAEVVSRFSGASAGDAYEGIVVNLPGALKLDRFDSGGPGIGYLDADPANRSASPFLREGVDIERRGDGFALVNNGVGEWQQYTVEFKQAGLYEVTVDYSATQASTLGIAISGQETRVDLEKGGKQANSGVQTAQGMVYVGDALVGQQIKLRLNHGAAGASGSTGATITNVSFQQVDVPPYAFDATYYSLKHGVDLAKAHEHFFTQGLRLGLRSSPLFDVTYYQDVNPALKLKTNQEALQHFLSRGAQAGLSAVPGFDIKSYGSAYPDLVAKYGTDYSGYLKHWLDVGRYDLGSERKQIQILEYDPAQTSAPEKNSVSYSVNGNSTGANTSSNAKPHRALNFRIGRMRDESGGWNNCGTEEAFAKTYGQDGNYVLIPAAKRSNGGASLYKITLPEIEAEGMVADQDRGWTTPSIMDDAFAAYTFSYKLERFEPDQDQYRVLTEASAPPCDGDKLYTFDGGGETLLTFRLTQPLDPSITSLKVSRDKVYAYEISGLSAARPLESAYVLDQATGAPLAFFDLSANTRRQFDVSRIAGPPSSEGITRKGSSAIVLSFAPAKGSDQVAEMERAVKDLKLMLVFGEPANLPSAKLRASPQPIITVWTQPSKGQPLQLQPKGADELTRVLDASVPTISSPSIGYNLQRGF